MPKRFVDLVRGIIPLSKEKTAQVERLRQILDEKGFRLAESLVRQRRLGIAAQRISFRRFCVEILKLEPAEGEDAKQTENINSKLAERGKSELWSQMSHGFLETGMQLIAPGIYGFDIVRKAILLQFFSPENIHILLLGDPGTGKTVFLQSVHSLFPVTSFGLGSGTSGAGLSVTFKGDEVSKGLLAMADGGICCIDELNLMKKEDRASLYSAMEKGFITYDKGGKHYRFDARISLLATANPVGDRFTGETMAEIKKEIPFDAALLTRFHLIFFVRKPSVERFMQISKKIIGGGGGLELSNPETRLLQEYVLKARSIEVKLPSNLEERMMEIVRKLKERELQSLVEITPRTVIGMIRMAKASARAELRTAVEEKDIRTAEGIITAAASGAVE